MPLTGREFGGTSAIGGEHHIVSKTYDRLIQVCGFSATIMSAGYVVAASLALSDGPGGIEVPTLVNMAVAVGVCASVVLGGAGWLIRHDNHASATRDMQPIIRAEVEAALDGAVPAIAAAVIDGISTDSRIGRIADAAAARTAGRLQEIVTGDVMAEVINAAVGRAHRAGMVMQAQSVVPKAVAPVVHMRSTTGDN